MKLLININQTGSLAAGHEAPNSTEMVDYPLANVPNDFRPIIARCYDPATGALRTSVNLKDAAAALGIPYEEVYTSCVPMFQMTHPLTPETIGAAIANWVDGIKAKIQASNERAELNRIERKNRTLDVLAKRQTNTSREYTHGGWNRIAPYWPYDADASVINSLEAQAWVAELAALNAEAEAAAIEREETSKRANEADRQAKLAYNAEFVAKHATPDQQERFAAGVLPSAELLRVIEDYAFEPMTGTPEYKPITDDEIRAQCDQDQCEGGDCECGTCDRDEPVSKYSAEIWAELKRLRAMLPGSTISVVRHQGTTKAQAWEDGITRYAAVVQVQAGPYHFKREYALNS